MPEPGLISPVLFVNNTHGLGGAERYVTMVANWMAARGSRVAVAAERGEMVDELGPGVRFFDLPLRKVRLGMPLAALRLRGVLREVRPAVIVANSLATTWIARLAAVAPRIPVVTVAHGWPADVYRSVGWPLRVADAVVAVSPDVRRKLVAAGLDGGRCEVVHNGVDVSRFGPLAGDAREAARASMGAGPGDVVAINVGRLMPQKAQHHVVAVAAALRDRFPALRFAVVGPGERHEELLGLIADRGVGDRVSLLGLRRDVPDLLGSADLYFSCSDWEGMPLATIEAMASGLPVVATATEGAGDLVTADCGVVVPIGDAATMEAGVARLAADPALRAGMAAAARERATAYFSHERMVRDLCGILSRAVGS